MFDLHTIIQCHQFTQCQRFQFRLRRRQKAVKALDVTSSNIHPIKPVYMTHRASTLAALDTQSTEL